MIGTITVTKSLNGTRKALNQSAMREKQMSTSPSQHAERRTCWLRSLAKTRTQIKKHVGNAEDVTLIRSVTTDAGENMKYLNEQREAERLQL